MSGQLNLETNSVILLAAAIVIVGVFIAAIVLYRKIPLDARKSGIRRCISMDDLNNNQDIFQRFSSIRNNKC